MKAMRSDNFNYRPWALDCMPTMACIDCGAVQFEAGTWQAMLVKMMPHYLEAHHDVISGQTEQPREDWMARFMEAYRAAERRQNGPV